MPLLFLIRCFCLITSLSVLGCWQNNKSTHPSIYNAWDARYKYDPITRKMYSVSQGEEVGLSWSRDAKGRVDFLHFYSGSQNEQNDENLLDDYKATLNRKRDSQWEGEREARISQVREQLEFLDSNKSDTEVAEDAKMDGGSPEDSQDAFLPIPDNFPLEPTNVDEGTPNQASPFLPLSPATDNVDNGSESFPPLP